MTVRTNAATARTNALTARTCPATARNAVRTTAWTCAAALWLVGFAAAQEAPKPAEAAVRRFNTALELYNRQSYEPAAEGWLDLAAQFPDDPLVPDARYSAGLAFNRLQRYADAETQFRTVVDKHPQSRYVQQAYTNLLRSLIFLKDDPKKLGAVGETASAALKRFPDSEERAWWHYYRGRGAEASKQFPEAVADYRAVAAAKPNPVVAESAFANLALLQCDLNDAPAAKAAVEAFLKAYPKSTRRADLEAGYAAVLANSKDGPAAEEWFAKALASPDLSDPAYARLRLASLQFNRKQYDSAGKSLAELAKLPENPYREDAALLAGRIAAAQNRPEEVRKLLTPLVDAKREDLIAPAGVLLAKALLDLKLPAEAKSLCERLLKQPKAAASASAADLKMTLADALYADPQTRPLSQAAYERVVQEHAEGVQAPAALYYAAFTAFETQRPADVTRLSDDFLKRFPADPLRPDVLFLAAETDRGQSRFDSAEKRFREIREKFPTYPKALDAVLNEARCREASGDPAGALKLLPAAEAFKPSPTMAAEIAAFRGDCLLKQKDWPAATDAYKKALAGVPAGTATARNRYRLGVCLLQLKRGAEAGQEWQAVVDAEGESPLGRIAGTQLARLEIEQANPKAAAARVTQLLAKASDDERPELLLLLVQATYGLKDWSAAEAAATALVASKQADDERKRMGRFWLGMSQAGAGKAGPAAKSLEALAGEKDLPVDLAAETWYELAWIRAQAGERPAAAEAFDRVVAVAPQHHHAADARLQAGENLYGEKNYDEAAKRYRAYLDAVPPTAADRETGLHKLAWCRHHQQQFEQAEKLFAEQLAAFPQGPFAADAQTMRGRSLLKMGRYAEALAQFETALKTYGLEPPAAKGPFVQTALLEAAQCCGKLPEPNWRRSLDLAKQFLGRYPDSPRTPEADFLKALALDNLGEKDEAAKEYQKVADSERANSELASRAWYMRGELLFDRKDHKEAVKSFFQAAYGFEPADPTWAPESLFEAGRCLEVLMKPAQARDCYQEILKKYADHPKAPVAKQRLEMLPK